MINSVEVRYDKLRNQELVLIKNEEKVYDFGKLILDFIYADVKKRYYEIIKDSNENNHNKIYENLTNLFNTDDTILCKLFYDEDYKRYLVYGNLSNYLDSFKRFDTKTKSTIVIENVKPFNSERDARVRSLLDSIEKTQLIYLAILNFCDMTTPSTQDNIYNRYINKFIYACKKLSYRFTQAPLTYDTYKTNDKCYNSHYINSNNIEITINRLKEDYNKDKLPSWADTNPIDECYYICSDIDMFFTTFMFRCFERKYIIPKCKNCGKFFVPYKNNSALYCDRPSPQNPNKTCKEYEGSKPKGQNELYRKIYQKKFAKASRNKEDYSLQKEFENWKKKAQKEKAKYNKGIISDDEYKQWLIDNDK